MKRLSASAPVALLLTTILSGCASTPKGVPSLQVDQPADCERVLARDAGEPSPPVLNDDWRVQWFKMRGAYRLERKIKNEGRECIANQRQLYRGK